MRTFSHFALLIFLSLAFGLPNTTAQVSVDRFAKARMTIPHRFSPAAKVTFSGHLHDKMVLALNNSLRAQDMEHLVEPFRHREEDRWWQSEFWGKWMLSAAKAYEYSGDEELFAMMEESTREMIATQTPDGYIGNYAPEHRLKAWDVWGRKYTMLGLLYFYDLSGDEKALQAATRLADHLMTEVGPEKNNIVLTGNYRGMASSSILEPIVLLYERTGETRYLDFAQYIVRQWEQPDGPQLIGKALNCVPVAERFPITDSQNWWTWKNGQKAYEMMSCYDGLLRLYQHTGTDQYFEAAYRTAINILEEEINIVGSGASMECWYHGREKQTFPAEHTMETCVTTTWMKLCYELHRLTGEPRWIDEIERSAYNNLLGSLTPDGSRFSKYSALQGYRDVDGYQCGMNINCCMANGPRGLFLLPDAAVMQRDKRVFVNLYNPGQASLELGKGSTVQLDISGGYPKAGAVSIALTLDKPETFEINLRLPAWSQNTRIELNGDDMQISEHRDVYFSIDRRWRDGDVITLHLDMRGRIIEQKEGIRTFRALAAGPIVLARDSRFGEFPVDAELTLAADENDFIELTPVENEEAWIAYRAPFAYGAGENPVRGETDFINFSDAGNRWKPENRYRVWIPQIFNPREALRNR